MSLNKKLEEYIHYLYGNDKDDPMYAPEVYQTGKDFSAGYESAKSKWHNVEDRLPEDDREVLCYIENRENPQWSGLKLGAFIGSKWYCNEGRKTHEIVIRWAKIPE